MKNIQKKAWGFYKNVETLNIDNITMFFKKKNFAVKYFEPDDKNVLELNPDAVEEKGFVLRSEAIRVVYILKELSVREKIDTMIHEAGHVLLDEDIDSDEFKQLKANMFSEYVKRVSTNPTAKYKLWKNKNIIIAACISLLAVVNLGISFYPEKTPEQKNNMIQAEEIQIEKNIITATEQSTKVYVTPTGKKYHTFNCQYVNPSTATELTIEDAEKRYDACKRCRPNEK